ncbi:hypothetical protein [Pantoea deleyi]|nr:hypothetical protein [Pantoea deleyi]
MAASPWSMGYQQIGQREAAPLPQDGYARSAERLKALVDAQAVSS